MPLLARGVQRRLAVHVRPIGLRAVVQQQPRHVDTARLLLERGAEVNRAIEGGATPLYIACEHGQADAARLLLENGAEVDRAMNDGSTPLSIAKSQGQAAVVDLLAQYTE